VNELRGRHRCAIPRNWPTISHIPFHLSDTEKKLDYNETGLAINRLQESLNQSGEKECTMSGTAIT
jgi:hypothetical protein